MTKKKSKKKGDFTFFKYIMLLVITAMAYLGIGVLGNVISANIIPVSSTMSTTTTETTNLEAIMLATKNKLVESNVFIQVNYEGGVEIGSGVIFDQDEDFYYALTNYHVIDGNQEDITYKIAMTYDSMASDYQVIKVNQEKDLAMIRFTKENRELITPIHLKGSTIIQADRIVVSIGNPYGERAVVNYGAVIRITYLQELEITHSAIEHTATLASGSSGGALVDTYGNLIGINTWELDGYYYAIPISVIYTFLEN